MKRLGSLLLTLALLISGCAQAPTRSNGEAPKDPAPKGASDPNAMITLNLLDLGIPQVTDAIISAYQAKHTNVRINRIRLTEFEQPPLVTTKELMAQGKVDVVAGTFADELVKEGALLALDPLIQRDGFDLKGFGSVPDQLRRDGKLYELPMELQGQLLIYNRGLLKAAGETIPQEGWTWERFRTLAAKLTTGQGAGKVWGVASALDEYLAQAYLVGRAGALPAVPAVADVKETMQFFSTMVSTDQSMAPSQERDWSKRAQGGFSYQNGAFEAGKAAFAAEQLVTVRGYARSLSRDGIELGFAPIPTSDGKGTLTNLYARTYGIAATSKQQDAAWEYLRFLTGPEGAAIMARYGTVPVYHSPEVMKAWFEQQPTPPPESEFLFTTDWQLMPDAGGPSATVWNALHNAFNRVLTGKQPWEASLDQYLQEVGAQ